MLLSLPLLFAVDFDVKTSIGQCRKKFGKLLYASANCVLTSLVFRYGKIDLRQNSKSNNKSIF